MTTISVVIPTHNRARYAVPTIRALLQLSNEIEVIVSDTSDSDDIGSLMANDPPNPRFHHLRPQRKMTLVENFNYALSAASGDYVIFLGDDDFLLSEIVDVAHWARKLDIDCVRFTFSCHYYWPDFVHRRRGAALAGTVHCGEYGGASSFSNGVESAQRPLREFGGGVFEMPRVYAGMVSTRLVKEIVRKHGELFGAVSPDIYSSYLLACESKKCAVVDFPAIVPGSAGGSGAGQSAKGGHIGRLRENAHIGAFQALVWDKRIPEFYSVATVWAYSLLKAVERACGDVGQIQFEALYAKCLVQHPTYLLGTLRAMGHLGAEMGYVRMTFRVLLKIGGELAAGGKKMIKAIGLRHEFDSSKVVIGSVEHSQEAERRVRKYVDTRGVKLQLEDG